MEEQPFIIHNTTIEPGQDEVVRIPIGRIPSGNQIVIKAHVFRSANPGPTVLLLGGVHGDEVNGVEIVRRMVNNGTFKTLQTGSVIAIPVLNVYGFINFSREVPDGKDVNRSFPGSMNGSLASRVARTLSNKIMPLVDLGVDFHTGGRSHYNYPQLRYTKGHERSLELAKAFAPPYILASKPISKSLRKYSVDHGKPMLVYEGGENLRLEGYSIEKGINGVRRLLNYLDMSPADFDPAGKSLHYTRTTWVRSPKAGLFRWGKCSGHYVHKGEPLGFISDPYGEEQVVVTASRDGHIIGHSNAAVVSQGDALFHLAYEPANNFKQKDEIK